MTETPRHGISVAYHSKAMALDSLSIDVNEEIVATSDENRSKFIELQSKALSEIDDALKRYAHVGLNRATFALHEKQQLVNFDGSTPSVKIMFFPLHVQEDAFTCMLCMKDAPQLDFRKMFPFFEKSQGLLDEIRKVTLVRGVNYDQQALILQRYANRFLQHAENDIAESQWSMEPAAMESEAVQGDTDKKSTIKERPDYVKLATLKCHWNVDFFSSEIAILQDDVSQELETLETIDDEYRVEFEKICIPIPLVTRLGDIVVGKFKALWAGLAPSFVPGWKQDLVQGIARHVMDEIDLGKYSCQTSIDTMKNEIQEKFEGYMQGFDEYVTGLESKFKGLENQSIDYTIFNAMLDGYKDAVGSPPNIDIMADAIKAARGAILATSIAPNMETDALIAEMTMDHVKNCLVGFKDGMTRFTLERVQQAIVMRISRHVEEQLEKALVQAETGIVQVVNAALVKKIAREFASNQAKRLATQDVQESEAILEPSMILEAYKTTARSVIAGFKIDTDGLLQFANEMLDETIRDIIAPHVQKFLALKRDVSFLKEFVLKGDVLNNYLDQHSEHFYDPKSFSKGLSDFVSEDLSQLPVEWGSLLVNWFTAFTNVFQLQHTQKAMTRPEIVQKFFDFIKIVADEQTNFDNTFAILSSYAGSLTDSKEKNALLEFLKCFEQSQEVPEKFLPHFENRIVKAIDAIDPSELEIPLDHESISSEIIKGMATDTSYLVPGTILVPSEIVLQLDKDAKVEFKLQFNAGADGLEISILTNWMRLMEAY
ncbi:MAG TPA: hypothetical protein VKM55_27600 [Candidatus Lokiarchaeia archaeon]|nr:hypothetical protein [Candidatus Lokiarchaeia archaeon]